MVVRFSPYPPHHLLHYVFQSTATATIPPSIITHPKPCERTDMPLLGEFAARVDAVPLAEPVPDAVVALFPGKDARVVVGTVAVPLSVPFAEVMGVPLVAAPLVTFADVGVEIEKVVAGSDDVNNVVGVSSELMLETLVIDSDGSGSGPSMEDVGSTVAGLLSVVTGMDCACAELVQMTSNKSAKRVVFIIAYCV